MGRRSDRPPPARTWSAHTWVVRLITLTLVVAVLVFGSRAVSASWSDVRASFGRFDPLAVVGAYLVSLVGTWAMYRGWRAALDGLGAALPPPDARTMFYVGQLGKYVPGSVWPALIQTEIGARHGLRRPVVLTSYVISFAASIGAGGLLTVFVLTGDTPRWLDLAALAATAGGVVVLALVAHPRGAASVIAGLVAWRTRAPMSARIAPPAVARVVGWGLLAWVLLGVHLHLLLLPLGATLRDGGFVVGIMTLGFVVGIAVVPLPAGAGLRELVVVAGLTALVGEPAALTAAVTSRGLLVISDLTLGALGGGHHVVRRVRGARRGSIRLDRSDPTPR